MATRLAFTLLTCALLFGFAQEADAKTDVLRTVAGRTVRWIYRDISIGMDPRAPSRTVSAEGSMDALRAAVDIWNQVPEFPLRFVVTDTPELAVRVRFCHTSWQGGQDDLGKAVFTADVETGEVSSAVAERLRAASATSPEERTNF